MKTLKHLLEQIDARKAELDALRPLKPEQLRKVKNAFRLWWNYHSNSLEGNTLTFGETRLLLLHGLTAQGKPLRHSLEVQGHDEAIQWLEEVVQRKQPLTEKFIRELHQLILEKRYRKQVQTPEGKRAMVWVEVGAYKQKPNHVLTSTGEVFHFASPEETPALMEELVRWINEQLEAPEAHPLSIAAELHYRFIRIHPFDDGNGRIARLLMNFVLLRFGFPPIIIRKEDKDAYLRALEQADAGMPEFWLQFLAENLLVSLEIMLRAARGEEISEEDDWKKDWYLLRRKIETEKPTVFFSPRLYFQRFKDSFRPLFERLGAELFAEFDEVFRSREVRIHYQSKDLASRINDDDEMEKTLQQQKDLVWICTWKDFNKGGTNTFDVDVELIVAVSKVGYRLKLGNRIPSWPSKRWDQPLTEEEIQQVVKEVGKHVISQIKKKKKKK